LYRAFGLNIDSEFEITGFEFSGGDPDVEIRVGKVPECLAVTRYSGAAYQISPDEFLLTVPNVARYHVSNGRRIGVQLEPGASNDAVRLFLFGSVFGALLYQRGLLLLHGSAVQTPLGAIVLAGLSGAGKSTLACAFSRRGRRVITDEIAAIDIHGRASVLPGHPFLFVWAEALQQMGIETAALVRARPDLEKFVLPLGDQFAPEPVPLHAIYILQPGNSPISEALAIKGLKKFETLTQNTYRPRFIEQMALESQQFAQIASIAGNVRVARITRPLHDFAVEHLVNLIERNLGL
jgi:hypothetical protein